MNIVTTIQEGVIAAVQALYGESIAASDITMNLTRKEFEGDYTIVTFPFTRFAKKKPPEIAADLGEFLVAHLPAISRYNVVQGFLNLVVSDGFWKSFLLAEASQPDYGRQARKGQKVMIEYCSPNTNKPLHLGHVRNILLGWSCSRIYEAAGYDVAKVQIINDRGIAICKSMLAWQLFADGSTPSSSGVKSDHFVGDYYVLFEQKFQEEYKAWQESAQGQSVYEAQRKLEQEAAEFFKAYKNQYFNDYSSLGRQARDMLQRWESGDAETLALWRKMNGWVYEGFEETFQRLGVSFDKIYYESDTYLSGKDLVEKGLASGSFYRKEDGSVWVDLTDAKLDHKVLLRSDGTSVYITQDLGTARQRFEDFGAEKMVYVVADEQNYHFQVLFETLKRLGEPYAEGLYHLSYGMVELPEGKMKSREGTVVDADDLIAEVVREARAATQERGEIAALTPAEQEEIYRKVGLAALKFHIIKVQPKKRMIFDPRESVDLQGHTGPHIQYAYVRINSVLRKAGGLEPGLDSLAAAYPSLEPQEKELIGQLYRYPEVILAAAGEFDPSTLANYCYELAKAFHRFFTDLSILKAETPEARAFRLALCAAVARVLAAGMDLLGIEMPERM
jgi:arginyl-tRNA synthetase